jgi:hypothetical protein
MVPTVCYVLFAMRFARPHQTVLMPNQTHHEDVEHGKHDQPGSVRIRETVKLIDNKESQYDQGCRIRPEFVPVQTDDREQLDNAVV